MCCLPFAGRKNRAESGVWRDLRRLALLLIYKGAGTFSTHGSEMYLGPCTSCGSNQRVNDSTLPRHKAPPKLNRRNIHPAIGRVLAHKREPFQEDATSTGVLLPTLAGDLEGGLSLLL